jgi:hypothetical protein
MFRGGPCSFGASTELVKKKVSEMFIFLNMTHNRLCPDNYVPSYKIGQFQKGLIEENGSYEMAYYK